MDIPEQTAQAIVRKIIDRLEPRERIILVLRRGLFDLLPEIAPQYVHDVQSFLENRQFLPPGGDGITLEKIGEMLGGLTKERIRQLTAELNRKLRVLAEEMNVLDEVG